MKSMTGFGAASAPLGTGNLRLEISGVNRKQAEVNINLPRHWSEFESKLRAMAQQQVTRGRVQISISTEHGDKPESHLMVNTQKLQELQAQLPQLQAELGHPISISLDCLERLNIIEQTKEQEMPLDDIWTVLEPAASQALKQFCAMRELEGANLKADLLERIATIRQYKEQLMERAPSIPVKYRENLLKRLEQSGLPLALDDERIIKEIALFCDRCDISEEMTRLDSHLDQFCQMCDKEESLGRSLDFLCQEIFRELNTTGSKANDAQLAQIVVAAKTELEKIREQVQNVE